jgi:hypothetical protein
MGRSFREELEIDVIPKRYSLLPNLFLPWNTCIIDEEQVLASLVHTMKKKIL